MQSKRDDRVRASIVAIAALGALVAGACEDPDRVCVSFGDATVWSLSLSSREGERIQGDMRVVDTAWRIMGVRTAPDGGTVGFDYPVENLRAAGDSVRFLFAPADYRVRGQCLDSLRVAVVYEAPVVNDGRPMRGTGTLQRVK